MRPRVYLAPLSARDRREFLERSRASRKFHRPWGAPATTDAAFHRLLDRSRRDDFEYLLVRRREDDAIAGVFSISQIFMGGFKSAYLGYYAFAPFQGMGYMREGLDLALRFAFRTRRLHRLEANIQPGNAASKKLVKRAGFRLEGFSPRYIKILGRWRDHERWAITVEDWRTSPTVRRARR